MSLTRFFTPALMSAFTRAKSADINDNLNRTDAGFRGVAGELDTLTAAVDASAGDREAVHDDRVIVEAALDDIQNMVAYKAQIGFLDAASSGEVLQLLEFERAVLFAANFADNDGALRGTAPSATMTLKLKKMLSGQLIGDAIDVGTIVVATNRAITRTSTSGLAITFPAGSSLLLVGDVVARGATNFAEVLVGTYA